MLVLNVVMLMTVSFFLGYYLGKGRIEIRKVLDKETSEKIAKDIQEQAEVFVNEINGGIY